MRHYGAALLLAGSDAQRADALYNLGNAHYARAQWQAAFEAAGWRSRSPSVLVGLPAGSRHELGALAFAVTAKRRGLDVHYLGSQTRYEVRVGNQRLTAIASSDEQELPIGGPVTLGWEPSALRELEVAR